jgi:hypothetical protein
VFAAIFSPLKERVRLHSSSVVYRSNIDAGQGKVKVSGLVDLETIVKKLNKVGKPAASGWEARRGEPAPKLVDLPALFSFLTIVSRSTKTEYWYYRLCG